VRRLFTLDGPSRERLIRTLADALAPRSDISFAYVFGSVLERDAIRDVDVAVWTTPGSATFVDMDLAASLSRLVPLPVDVRRVNDAAVPFLFHVLQGRPLAVRDELLLAAIMERTAREYHDMAPLLRRATREAFAV
jgi:predicted nucleotidyltransferase